MFESIFGKKSVKRISPAEVKEKMTSGDNIILLDVRTPQEYRDVHIPKSISLPLDQLTTKISKVVNNKDAEIIVYCLSGMRSATACSQLEAMGYSNISNMGGIQSWRYEIEQGA